MLLLKGQSHEIFYYCFKDSTKTLYDQAKTVSQTFSFSPRYSFNHKFRNSSTTKRTQTFSLYRNPTFSFFLKFLLFSMFSHPNTCFPLKSVRSLNRLLLVSGFSHFHVCNYADTVSTYMLVVNKYADTKSVPSINNTDTCQHSQRLCGHTFSECIHSC